MPENNSEIDARLLTQLERSELEFLVRLSLVLSATLDVREVVRTALEELKNVLHAEAATVFLREEEGNELTFWALEGGSEQALVDKRMPGDKGIVGSVIANRVTEVVNDTAHDPRFFSDIDREGGFKTKNLVCAPLEVRNRVMLGAIQVLNKQNGAPFSERDRLLLECFARHIAPAIDNARLFGRVQEHAERLEELDKRRQDMLSLIGHEFRTPLNIVQTSAELLISGLATDANSRQRMYGTLQSGVSRLARILNQVREAQAVGEATFELQLELVDVAKIFETLRVFFAQAVRDRSVKVSFQSPGPEDLVKADPTLLLVALRNLISNGIRFTPDGGEVRVTAARAAGMLEIAVSDTGIGIPDSAQEIIFEKFYEIGDTLHHRSGEFEFKSGGLGLGLAAVKAILKAHGTSAAVESHVGRGSRFSFCLRLAKSG